MGKPVSLLAHVQPTGRVRPGYRNWRLTLEQEPLPHFSTIEDVQSAMFKQHYIADRSLATAVYLALKRRKPLLLEGEPGVGKTEIAKVLAAALNTPLIRLQCYEG